MLTKAKLREGGRKRWEGVSAEARKAWAQEANRMRWANASPADREAVAAAMAAGRASKRKWRKDMRKRSS